MPASEETGSGPVIHDHRRIDPVTGQVRGKHAASKPAGTTGAGRPAGPGSSGTGSGSPGTGSGSGTGSGAPGTGSGSSGTGSGSSGTGSGSAGGASGAASGAANAKNGPDEAGTADATEEVVEGIVEDTPVSSQKQSDAEARLAERTADLQRLQAEYANYRKRVDRDRAAVREQAVATVLTGLLPVLDAINQAREHGELSGGFKSVADSLQ